MQVTNNVQITICSKMITIVFAKPTFAVAHSQLCFCKIRNYCYRRNLNYFAQEKLNLRFSVASIVNEWLFLKTIKHRKSMKLPWHHNFELWSCKRSGNDKKYLEVSKNYHLHCLTFKNLTFEYFQLYHLNSKNVQPYCLTFKNF